MAECRLPLGLALCFVQLLNARQIVQIAEVKELQKPPRGLVLFRVRYTFWTLDRFDEVSSAELSHDGG